MPGDVDLSVDVAGLRLKNPVLPASGTFGYGHEPGALFDVSRLGAVVLKGTTLHPRPGNPPPRIVETTAGMLNSIGLENPGIDAVVSKHLPLLAGLGVPVIVNVAGDTVEEYVEVARRLDRAAGLIPAGLGLELNISCPNVDAGGLEFGRDPALAGRLVGLVRAATGLPLIVKLSPHAPDVVEMGRAVQAAGADAISLVNTMVGMAIDIWRRRPVLGGGTGGLSGPAIKPVAVAMVYELAQQVEVPLIGMGGIATWQDAVEFILAGASAVAVGAALFANPLAPLEIIDGLTEYCRAQKASSVRDLIGAALPQRGS